MLRERGRSKPRRILGGIGETQTIMLGGKTVKVTTMQRKIRKLENLLAERDHQVWTLKQLLLYK